MKEQWLCDADDECVIVDGGEVRLTTRPRPTKLGRHQCLVMIIGACWCGADLKRVNGDKAVPEGAPETLVLGHEAAGRVVAVGSGVRSMRPGDIVSVLPHVYAPGHLDTCPNALAGCHELCVGAGHATHTGFDHDGVMADFIVMDDHQLVVLPSDVVDALSKAAPDLPAGALGCYLEPILCVLCAFERLRQSRSVSFEGAKVLVVGGGHIGNLHLLAWLGVGANVWVRDSIRQREILSAQICGEDRVTRWSVQPETDFDVIIDTTGTAAAIKESFGLVADGGILYLMAGLRRADRGAFDPQKVVNLEQVHRHGMTIMIECGPDRRCVWVTGHSGLRRGSIPMGLEFLVANAGALSRMATGVVRGLSSPTVESRNHLVGDWTSTDAEPAALAILRARPGTKDHISPIIVPTPATDEISLAGAA